MRLINIHTLETKDFPAARPEYAILSHRWEGDETSYQAFQHFKARTGPGFSKIESFCNLVKQADWAHGNIDSRLRLEWVWVDTCCIDKTSSAELSEAINSMWTWYQDAAVCVAYLSDCEISDKDDSRIRTLRALRSSPWFRRGWTLQELLAPKDVLFYTHDWQCLGRRNTTADLRQAIVLATSIEEVYLEGRKHVARASIAQRMSWASARKTTRGEDSSYCLMGLFNVNLPLLYGEGQEKAFYRLQEQIVKQSNDESIFAFGLNMYGTQPALASSPQEFVDCESVRVAKRVRRHAYTINNSGLEFSSPAINWKVGENSVYILNLNCGRLVYPSRTNTISALSTKTARLRGCIMVLRQMGDRFVRDLSWEKQVEDLSPTTIERMHREGDWSKIESMRFYLAVTPNDVYSAEIDEKQHALNIHRAESIWYEDNDGPMFWGYTAHEQELKDMPGIDNGSFESSDEETEDRPSAVTADVPLGPFELEA